MLIEVFAFCYSDTRLFRFVFQVCSPNVASQFARVAHATDFIYCYTILESNRRSDVSSSDGLTHQISLSALTHGLHLTSELNTFFPFDPYKLPKSGVYIQEVYREWASVAIDEESDDEDGESDLDGDGDSDEEHDTSAHVTGDSAIHIPMSISSPSGALKQDENGTDQGLGASFDAMSISPVKAGIQAMERAPECDP